MTIEVDVDLANLLRKAINEILHEDILDESDEDKLMDLRDQLRDFVASQPEGKR